VKDVKVVVTGLGWTTPLGLEVKEGWDRLLRGVSGIGRPSFPGAESCPVQAVGKVGEEDLRRIERTFPLEAAAGEERSTLFALWAAKSAWEDAGLCEKTSEKDRWGVAWATGLEAIRLEDAVEEMRGPKAAAPEVQPRSPIDRPSSLIASSLGLRGIHMTLTSACASATQAIGLGYRSIRGGLADLMVCGGSDSMIDPVGLGLLVLLSAASTREGDPRALCRPFDRKRSGLVVGEGAGCVVLESLDHARKRRAPVYAEMAGYGSSMDACGLAAPAPGGEGARRAMQGALDDARLKPADLDYINAHGTGTRLNDPAEAVAIREILGEHANRVAVNSTKSMTGHLMAAAGGPEFVVAVLSVVENVVHPTLNLDQPARQCRLNHVVREKKALEVRAALSNSFGFGGQNASVIVKKHASRPSD